MEQRGLRVRQPFCDVGFELVSEIVAEGLRVPSGTRALKLIRLRSANDEPVVLFTSWFHPRLGLSGKEDFTRPLYSLLEEDYGVTPVHSAERISAQAAHFTLAQRLGIAEGAPVLVRRRIVSDAQRQVIEYAVVEYRGDRFEYALEIQREATKPGLKPEQPPR
jgi:GntR family transcriptional regulator